MKSSKGRSPANSKRDRRDERVSVPLRFEDALRGLLAVLPTETADLPPKAKKPPPRRSGEPRGK